MQALEGYVQLRDHLQPRPTEPAFLVSLNRTRLLYAVVQLTFRQLINNAGIGAGGPVRRGSVPLAPGYPASGQQRRTRTAGQVANGAPTSPSERAWDGVRPLLVWHVPVVGPGGRRFVP